MEAVIKTKFPRVRILFWNSPGYTRRTRTGQPTFQDGIFINPYVCGPTEIAEIFLLIKPTIANEACTFTNLAFSEIPRTWLCPNGNIYLLTDGQIGYANISRSELNTIETLLASSVHELKRIQPTLAIHILSFETKDKDFSSQESLTKAAGCDVYETVQKHKLSGQISTFASYGPTSVHYHIKKIIVPLGCYGFDTNYFAQERMHEFMHWIQGQIDANSQDRIELLRIIQNLSVTVAQYLKAKPSGMKHAVIGAICDMFGSCILSTSVVNFILTGATNSEESGSAQLFTSYQSTLNDLYKQANEMLSKDVGKAIGITSDFMTLPVVHDITVYGRSPSYITEMIQNYPNCGVKFQGYVLPALPMKVNLDDNILCQCIRQYMRSMFNKYLRTDIYDDTVIYWCMLYALRAKQTESLPQDIKDAFSTLAKVMLHKKRPRDNNQTEYAFLLNGGSPDMTQLNAFSSQLNLGGMSITSYWYLTCEAVSDELAIAQKLNCPNIYSDIKAGLVLPDFKYAAMGFEYICPITLDDTSCNGGWIIKRHREGKCSPVYVISQSGFEELQKYGCICPICHHLLDPTTDFEQIPGDAKTVADNLLPPPPPPPPAKTTQKKPVIITMKGVVGSGKTSAACLLVDYLGSHRCLATGTDKFCVDQKLTPAASVRAVSDEIRSFLDRDFKGQTPIIIIDTCGERGGLRDVFGHNFTGCMNVTCAPNFDEKKLQGYLYWSLNNVMQRPSARPGCGFYLNPTDASCATCVGVFKKKAQALYGKKKINASLLRLGTFINQVSEVLSQISTEAEFYGKSLEPLGNQMRSFISTNRLGDM
jgi:hypothetical protein